MKSKDKKRAKRPLALSGRPWHTLFDGYWLRFDTRTGLIEAYSERQVRINVNGHKATMKQIKELYFRQAVAGKIEYEGTPLAEATFSQVVGLDFSDFKVIASELSKLIAFMSGMARTNVIHEHADDGGRPIWVYCESGNKS